MDVKTDGILDDFSSFSKGGFAPHPGHDPHLHSTLSAIQILVMQDSLDCLDKEKVIECQSVSTPNTISSLYHWLPLLIK